MSEDVRVLSSGVDTLHAAVEGVIRPEELARLTKARDQDDVVQRQVKLTEEWPEFAVQPHGWRGFPIWLRSARAEVMAGAPAPFPAVFVQWHSAFLHADGPTAAIQAVRQLLEDSLLKGPYWMLASRIDVYADFQGWIPRASDLGHFQTRAVRRTEFEVPVQGHHTGRRFTGFTFGKGDLVCRLYDKTEELRLSRSAWLEEVWQGRDPDQPVWRLEFQFRRRALVRLNLAGLVQAVDSTQALWRYGTCWVSHREPTPDRNRSRWPVSPKWAALGEAVLSQAAAREVRRRVNMPGLAQLLPGFLGYASSLAALSPEDELEPAMLWLTAMAGQHLARQHTRFQDLVRRKRAQRRSQRLLSVAALRAFKEGLT